MTLQPINMMKRVYIAILVLVCALSCKTGGEEDNGHYINGRGRPGVEREYKFLSVDACKPELKVNYSSAYGGWFAISLDFRESYPSFFEKNMLKGEWAAEKGKHLREELKKYGLYEAVIEGDYEREFICAGVSGDVLIYADTDVAGRQAGEDLSDLFECVAKGRILYPEMDIVADDHLTQSASDQARDDAYYNYKDYYSLSIIPIVGVTGIWVPLSVRPLKEYNGILDSPLTLHFVIPITGLDIDGIEKSMVLSGVYSNETAVN